MGFPYLVWQKKIGVDRKTIYNKFDEANLSLDFIIEVGKTINYDFGNDEKGPFQIPNNLDDCRNELLKKIWENFKLKEENYELSQKYIKLLEESDRWKAPERSDTERKTG